MVAISAACAGHAALLPTASSEMVRNACHGRVTAASPAVPAAENSSAPTSTRHGPTRSLNVPMSGTASRPTTPSVAMT